MHFIGLAEMDVMAVKRKNMRDQEKERHWRRLMEEWKASNLSGAAFRRQTDLKESTFYSWIKVIAARDREAKAKTSSNEPMFVPVAIKASGDGRATSEVGVILQRVEIWCSNGNVVRAASMTTRALIELLIGLGKGTC